MGREAFLDGVLMAARERGIDQLAAIGMALVHGQFVAVLHRLDNPVNVGEIEAGIDTLRVHVERHGHEAAISGPLAVPEEATFHPVGPGHQRQLGGCHAGATIVMGVKADDRTVPIGQVADEIFHLVCVDIRSGRFHRRRQVEDDRMLGSRGKDLHHSFANLEAEIELCGGECFRRILEVPVGARLLRRLVPHDLCAANGDVAHLLPCHAENDFAPCGADRVVEVHDGLLRPLEAGEARTDQVFPALGEDLHQHIVRDAA